MKNSKWGRILLILLTAFIVAACNLPCVLNPSESDEADISDSYDEPEEEVDPRPIGIREGLASFDSYSVSIYLLSLSSDGTKSESQWNIERSVIDKTAHSITVTNSFDPEYDTEEQHSTTEMFEVGNETCQGSEGDWEYSEVTSQEKELAGVFVSMADFYPVFDNPEFVGEENINGIDCYHFTFEVAGIGDTSGSIATTNTGDYWLAIDGQYLVKYDLSLEVQSAATDSAEAETSTIEASFELTDVNIPISVSIPEGCSAENSE